MPTIPYTLITEVVATPSPSQDETFIPQFDDDGNQTPIKTSTGIWSVAYNGENRPILWENVSTNSPTSNPSTPNPSLQVEILLGGFCSHEGELVNCWTFPDQIVVLARSGRSIVFSFCNDAKGKKVCVEIPASFVKLLAKYKFSFRLAIV